MTVYQGWTPITEYEIKIVEARISKAWKPIEDEAMQEDIAARYVSRVFGTDALRQWILLSQDERDQVLLEVEEADEENEAHEEYMEFTEQLRHGG